MPSPALKHIFNELQYELTNKLAEGGMGLVFEAVQKRLVPRPDLPK